MSEIQARNIGAAGNFQSFTQHNHFYGEPPQPLSDSYNESDVRKFFDSLREIYRERYEQKIGKLLEINLKARRDWNPQNLQNSGEENAKSADAGDEAVKVIEEEFLKAGRLLIVGNAGTGKTVLLLKLANDLLQKIASPEIEPFPVIFNLALWSHRYERFGDWLIDMMVSGMGLSRGFAAELLNKRRIIFLFDGLDEVRRNESNIALNQIRAKCLQSLNLFLEGNHQTVICCRADEFARLQKETGKDAPVATKIEVLNLTKDDILSALERAGQDARSRVAANHLSGIIEKNADFLDILDTPFYFATALEVFNRHLLEAIDLSADKAKLKRDLLAKFIDKKLNSHTETGFAPAKAREWLAYLALMMQKKRLGVFELADLQPQDSSLFGVPWWRGYSVMFGLIGGVGGILITGLFLLCTIMLGGVFATAIDIANGEKHLFAWASVKAQVWKLPVVSLVGVPCGLIVGLIVSWSGRVIQTADKVKLNLLLLFRRKTWNEAGYDRSEVGCNIVIIILFIILLAIAFLLYILNLLSEPFFYRVFNHLSVILSLNIVIVLIYYTWNLYKACKALLPFAGIKTPYQRFRVGVRRTFIKIIVLVILTLALSTEIAHHPYHVTYQDSIFMLELGVLLSSYFLTLFMIFSLPLFKHSVLRLCFYFQGVMPLKYAAFLDYAAEIGILEKDGGQWRFRHQDIQETFITFLPPGKEAGRAKSR